LRPLSWPANTTGVQRAPHPCWSIVRNVVSPYRFFRKEGRKAVRLPDGGAGMGVRGSECPPVVGGIRGATSPDAQAGCLLCGVDERETLRNRSRGRCK